MDTTGMINIYNITVYLFKYEEINMHDKITILKLQYVPRGCVNMRKYRETYI